MALEPSLSLTSLHDVPLGLCGWASRAASEAAHNAGLLHADWCTCHATRTQREKRR